MNNFKNLLILTLTALLGLSLFSQPAQSLGSSKAALAIQYDNCLEFMLDNPDEVEKIWPHAIKRCQFYIP